MGSSPIAPLAYSSIGRAYTEPTHLLVHYFLGKDEKKLCKEVYTSSAT